MRLFITVAVFFLGFVHFAYAKGMPTLENIRDLQESLHKPLVLDYVIDGDTIVADKKKIRLWGINAPEKKKPYFHDAKNFLKSFIIEGRLFCKLIEKDRYQRDVMHCLIDGLDIGSIMVQSGMAKDYSKYSGNFYQYEEELAKAKKLGIWSEKADKEKPDEQIMCSMDAKLCPDGSYASRQGPNCEFEPCSGER